MEFGTWEIRLESSLAFRFLGITVDLLRSPHCNEPVLQVILDQTLSSISRIIEPAASRILHSNGPVLRQGIHSHGANLLPIHE